MRSYTLHRIFLALIVVADIAVLAGSFQLAWWVRFGSGWIAFHPPAPPMGAYLRVLPATLLLYLLAMNYAGLFQRRSFVVGEAGTRGVLIAVAVATLLMTGLGFLYRDFSFSRLILLVMAAQNLVLLRLERGLLRAAQVALRRRGVGVIRVAILGDGREARAVGEALTRHRDYGFRVAGFVSGAAAGRLPRVLRRLRVDEVVLAPPRTATRGDVMRWVEACARAGVECKMLANIFGYLTSRLAPEELFGMPLLTLKPLPLDGWGGRAVKRALDLVLTVPALILLAPLLALVAAAVRLESPGPALYRQERTGRRGRPFFMLKFRSMRQDAERRTGPVWARKDDPRRTRLGGFLRRTSLDELPQLLNILRGEMSIVGPRPERPHFVAQFTRSVPRYADRHAVRPGLTGWAQVNGLRGNTPVEDRTRYDLSYVENWSAWLDLRIIFRTGMEVFHHTEAY